MASQQWPGAFKSLNYTMNRTQANYLATELQWERDIFNSSYFFLTDWIFAEMN